VAWWLDDAGRRVVERKDATRAKLGRSPDDADALLLAYLYLGTALGPPADVPDPPPGQRMTEWGDDEDEGHEEWGRHRRRFGR
jgi:hypothetical protein